MSLGDNYINAIQEEIDNINCKSQLNVASVSLRSGLNRAIEIIRAIDKHEMDKFMDKLLWDVDTMDDDNSI